MCNNFTRRRMSKHKIRRVSFKPTLPYKIRSNYKDSRKIIVCCVCSKKFANYPPSAPEFNNRADQKFIVVVSKNFRKLLRLEKSMFSEPSIINFIF